MNKTPRIPLLSEGILIFSISFAWMFFWTWGQPFFDEDYMRWLEPASVRSFLDIGRMFTLFPQDWGFLDKPVELLFFKTLYSIFGMKSIYFYLAKCILFGITSILVFILTTSTTKNAFPDVNKKNYAAAVAVLLFITFEPSFLSTLWLSDFEILSELAIAGSLVIYLYYLQRLDSGKTFSLIGKVLFQLSIFIVAFIGYKTKSTAKIIPLLIGLHAASKGKKTFIHFSPLLLALVIVNIPWLTLSDHPLPPILDFSKKQVLAQFYWQPANLKSFFDLLIGGEIRIWPFSTYEYVPYGLIQVLFPFGIMNIAVGVLFLYFNKGNQKFSEIVTNLWESDFLVIIIWMVLTVCLVSGYPIISNDLRSRHLLFLLIPVCIFIGFLNSRVLSNGNIHVVIKIAVTSLLIFQLLTGIYQTDIRKRTSGYLMMMGNKARQFVENSYRNANIIVLDFPDTGYIETGKGNEYYWIDGFTEASQTFHELAKKENELYLLVPYGTNAFNPDWHLESEVRMETGWYYDVIGSSIPQYNLNIYKFKHQR